MYNTERLKVNKIYLQNNSSLSEEDIRIAMQTCYKHVKFSTFSYKKEKKNDSNIVLSKYLSGNCIASAKFIQTYLEENHKSVSYIISASVPKVNKIENTPHACHCALLVPLKNNKFAIVDCAFYFDNPLICSLDKLGHIQSSLMCDVYANNKIKVNYKLEKCKKRLIDESFNQILLPHTLCVNCHYDTQLDQTWKYYLNEVTNPDESIGSHYLNNIDEDFVLYTLHEPIHNQVYIKYKLKQQKDGNFNLKSYPGLAVTSYDNLQELFDDVSDVYFLMLLKKILTSS